jgi:hypothetical protein
VVVTCFFLLCSGHGPTILRNVYLPEIKRVILECFVSAAPDHKSSRRLKVCHFFGV